MTFNKRLVAASLVSVLPALLGAQTPTVEKTAKVGDAIYEIAASPSSNTIWVATVGVRDKTPAMIYGLDAKTLQTKTTIDVASSPAYGLGVNDATQTLYTSNTRNGSVSAIDAKTGKVISTITVPSNPRAHLMDVLVDEQTNMVYVSVAGDPGSVWVIDGKKNELVKVIDSLGTTATGLAIDHATNQLYVASMGTNEVLAVDLASGKIAKRIATNGQRSTRLAFDPSTSRLFVTNQGTNDVSVIDTKAGAVVKNIPTGTGALGIDLNPKTGQVFVANRGAGTVTVIDGKSFNVVANLTAGSLPNTVAADPRSNAVYVTSKAKSGARGAPPVVDPNGDVVTLIKW